MSEFIKITKDGETIEVHPLTLEDHKHLGWKVVEAPAEVEAPAAAQPEPKPEGKKLAKGKKGA
jgi:hypothetical protein